MLRRRTGTSQHASLQLRECGGDVTHVRRDRASRIRRSAGGKHARRLGRRLAWAVVSLCFLIPCGVARADVEPNSIMGLAEGPLAGGVSYRGTTPGTDVDWYVFYVSGQVELNLTLSTTTGCLDGNGINFELTPAERDVDYFTGSRLRMRGRLPT
jgi:hypothetical protein